DAVDADLAGDQAHVAGAEQEYTGAVADRVLAYPNGPARRSDEVANANGIFHLTAEGDDIKHTLADLEPVGDACDALDQGDEIDGDATSVTQAQHAAIG